MKAKPMDRPIEYLGLFETNIEGDLASVKNQYELLLPVRETPSVLNDEIVQRILRLHGEKRDFVKLYDRQFKLWREQQLTPEQSRTLDKLERLLPQLDETNEKVLEIAKEIEPYTIEKIMAMDAAELVLLQSSGKLKPPY